MEFTRDQHIEVYKIKNGHSWNSIFFIEFSFGSSFYADFI